MQTDDSSASDRRYRRRAPCVLDLERWAGPATPTRAPDPRELDGPVLDVGCGPGRLVAALRNRGVQGTGYRRRADGDRVRDGRAVAGSCSDPCSIRCPREGTWADGVAVRRQHRDRRRSRPRSLRRVARPDAADGCVDRRARAAGCRASSSGVVEFEVATGMVGRFPWCWVGAEEIRQHRRVDPDCESTTAVPVDGRWFAWLRIA